MKAVAVATTGGAEVPERQVSADSTTGTGGNRRRSRNPKGILMRQVILLLGAVLVVGGCSTRTGGGLPVPGSPEGGVVIVEDEGASSRDGGAGAILGRSAGVPAGHYPPPGECRIWYPSREPGQQPVPGRCDTMVGRVPFGAFLLYHDKAWDTQVDWHRQESRRPGSVPDIVLRIMNSLIRP